MDDHYPEATWKEQGVGSWARDCGFSMTKEADGLYNLWRSNPRARILSKVELADIERYLEIL
jgi:hypothetical protein